DPLDEDFEVRMRIDGRLQHYCNLSHGIGRHIIGQLKTLTDLPMTDSLHTWEGRLHLPRRLNELEVRMTSSPVAGGEALALRILDRKHALRPLQELGLSTEAEQDVRRMISHREGLVLVVGPTNSGKTTTVYSILSELNDKQQNIISIEDPAEVSVPFVRQLTVDSNHGRTMASGLQTVLRMDPDVIFVGEVRDPTTASLTMRAASSGQYVLSTLHARDAASAVTALRDLDLDGRSIAGHLTGVISQRLIRRVCKECAVKRACTEEEKQLYQQHQLPVPESVLDARGCDTCRDTGYLGMTGVFEAVVLSGELKSAIEGGHSEEELRAQLIENDKTSITVDALRKAASHITSLS
ncbi:MAG: ATPase, T2SS/T4P/T4SS family, partial [Lacipirellulaceae bacterium]